MTLNGRAVFTKRFDKGTATLPLRFPCGEYVVVAHTGEVSVIEKVMIAAAK